MSSKEIGILGEKIAENYLKKKGYKILEKNYYPKLFSGPKIGEVDLIAKENDVFVFVEVKTIQNSQNVFFNPEDKVNFTKQRKIIKTAESWLVRNKIPLETKWQIDVLAIIVDLEKHKAKIRHFKNIII